MEKKFPDWVKTSEDYERWKNSGGTTSTSSTKTCPFCSEEIKASAVKCKHCGSMLDGSQNKADVSISAIDPFAHYKSDITMRKGKLSVLGYIGIVLGVFIIIMGFVGGRLESNEEVALIPMGFGAFLSIGCYLWARRSN
ncbi:MAG: hypothetical protein HZB62_10555 [Nitrospirae bacterium]|nr:hypothetical protein [Nitrospirota bacterium]